MISGKSAFYIFLDEAGNLDFSGSGTKYFCMTCIAGFREGFYLNKLLDDYKYDLVEFGSKQKYFHASDDNKFIRKKVFEILEQRMAFYVKSVVVEKRLVPKKYQENKEFYLKVIERLLVEALPTKKEPFVDKLIVITDRIPVNKKRDAIEKAVKHIIKDILPENVEFEVMHHDSMAHYGLQVADYCNWAIFNKWERGNQEFYKCIKSRILLEEKLEF